MYAMNGGPSIPKAMNASAQLAEVAGSIGTIFVEQTEDDSADRLASHFDVKLAF
jgi:hypothetical protein